MARVVKRHGKIVIFTADPRICFDTCWISDYFREIIEQSFQSQPRLEEFKDRFEKSTGRMAHIDPFLLPHNLKDKFFFSGWKTPEEYLNEQFRSGISSLASAPEEVVERNVKRLNDDLTSGKFYKDYGDIVDITDYDCGYFFLVG